MDGRQRTARSRTESGVQADSPPPPLSAGRKVSLTCGNTNYTLVIATCRFASFCGLLRPGCGLDPDTHVRFAPALRGQAVMGVPYRHNGDTILARGCVLLG